MVHSRATRREHGILFKLFQMDDVIRPNYDKLHSIFTDKFLQLANQPYEAIVNDVHNVLDKSELTKRMSTLISTHKFDMLNPHGYKEVLDSNNITGNRTSKVVRVILTFNDMLNKVNTIMDFHSPLGKSLFLFYKETIKRSSQYKNGYQALTKHERVMALMYVLCDLIVNHDANLLGNFADRLNHICGRKNGVYGILHGLCHNSRVDEDLKTCASDLYMLYVTMTNFTRDGLIEDGYISKHVFSGACERCELAPWINPKIWTLIVQDGIYLKRASEGIHIDVDVYNKFIGDNGGNLLNMLGLVYVGKKDFKLLYCVGMLYSLIAPGAFELADGGTCIAWSAFKDNNGVVSTIQHNGTEYVATVIEQQDYSLVYYSLSSTQPLNYDRVGYYTPSATVQTYAATPDVGGETPTTSSTLFTGGYLAPKTVNFSENQMATFGELVSYAIIAYLMYTLISYLVTTMRTHVTFKSRLNIPVDQVKSDDKKASRVGGVMNVDIPDTVETYTMW